MSIVTGRGLVAFAALMGVFVAMPATAQPAAPGASSDLEEIVVTARKREEASQNVPITMSVFTAQEIQSAGIDSPRATSSQWCRT
jgi:iron complex outermembrane recepter protein